MMYPTHLIARGAFELHFSFHCTKTKPSFSKKHLWNYTNTTLMVWTRQLDLLYLKEKIEEDNKTKGKLKVFSYQ